MAKSRLEWRVGLFVFVGLVLLGALLLQFSKGTTFFHPVYHILMRSANAGGLKVRASVLMSGVQVGTISDIKLAPQGTNVTITLKIYNQYEIHKDARFVIEQSGFLGDQYVAIMPTKNEGPVFADNDTAQAEAPFSILEVARSAGGFLSRLDETASKLNAAILDVRRLVLNEPTLTNLATAVSNIRIVSEHALTTVDNLNGLVQTNSPSIALAVSNLVFFSEEINLFARELSTALRTNTTDLTTAMKNIESSTAVLKTLMDDLQAGKGLAGNLLKNEELAAHVSQIAYNLSVTSSNLNRLGLWGILWQHKPPGTNAPAAPPRALLEPKHSSD